MNGSCLGEFANPSPQRVRSLVEQESLVAAGVACWAGIACCGSLVFALVTLLSGEVRWRTI